MQSLLVHHGYVALAVLALLQAACLPIPSEVTLGFAGVLAGEGHLNLAAVVVFGTSSELVGSYVAYTVGRVGGRPLVARFGRYVLVGTADLDRAERWLAGRGEASIAIGRALPVVRALVSVVAGITEMPRPKFLLLSFLGTLAYVSALSSIGYAVGPAWRTVAHDLSVGGYVVAGVVAVAAVAYLARRVRSVRRDSASAALAPELASGAGRADQR
ncbi:MAG TPA: DedA family protein [Acidimicrobiales bacterium]|nr:DedA family protein [Acidimicrobiales bacterium]